MNFYTVPTRIKRKTKKERRKKPAILVVPLQELLRFFLPCATRLPLHRATRTLTNTGQDPTRRLWKLEYPPTRNRLLPSSNHFSRPPPPPPRPRSPARPPPPPPMATSTRALLLLPLLLLFLLSRSLSLRADPGAAVSRIAFGSCANQSAPQVLDEMRPPFATLISDQ